MDDKDILKAEFLSVDDMRETLKNMRDTYRRDIAKLTEERDSLIRARDSAMTARDQAFKRLAALNPEALEHTEKELTAVRRSLVNTTRELSALRQDAAAKAAATIERLEWLTDANEKLAAERAALAEEVASLNAQIVSLSETPLNVVRRAAVRLAIAVIQKWGDPPRHSEGEAKVAGEVQDEDELPDEEAKSVQLEAEVAELERRRSNLLASARRLTKRT